MTLRLTASTVSFVAGGTDNTVKSTIANLTDFVTGTTSLKPRAITLIETPPADVLVKEVVIKAEKNPEAAHRVYKGPGIPLGDIMGAFSREANRDGLGLLTPLRLPAEHGLEIEFKYDGGASQFDATLLWDIQNKKGGIPAWAFTDHVPPGMFRGRGNKSPFADAMGLFSEIQDSGDNADIQDGTDISLSEY